MASEVASLFAKKKGKKGKKKAINLNLESGLPKTEEKPKIVQLQEILGGPDPSEDDGWAEVVEKKSVVATGGKQVSDLIDMSTLMTEEESTASKLEKQDIKQAFHDARTLKEKEKKEEEVEVVQEEVVEVAPKSKGLSGNIFGGGAGRPGGLLGGWQARMQERELKQREQELSVDNTFAFPSLADAMSGPAKSKHTAAAPEQSPWARRGAGSAAAAAIKAALGKPLASEGDEPKACDGAAAPKADAPPAPGGAGPAVAAGSAAPPPAAEDSKAAVAAPVWVAPRSGGAAAEADAEKTDGVAEGRGGEGVASATDTATAQEGAGGEGAAAEVDTEALVQQFGKKKKKKKKPVEGEQAGGEP